MGRGRGIYLFILSLFLLSISLTYIFLRIFSPIFIFIFYYNPILLLPSENSQFALQPVAWHSGRLVTFYLHTAETRGAPFALFFMRRCDARDMWVMGH